MTMDATKLADNLSFCRNIICGVIFCLLTWKIIRQLISRTPSIPSPKGSLLAGHFWQLKNSKDGFYVLQDWTKQYGPILRFRSLGLFGEEYILIADADAAKQILVTNSYKYERSDLFKTIFPIASNGLLSSVGKDHSRQKRMISPAFNFGHLKGMLGVFRAKTALLVQLWSHAINSNGNEQTETKLFIHKDVLRLTLDIIGECAFGYQFNSLTEESNVVASIVNALLQGLSLTNNPIRFIPILRNIPTKARREENVAMDLTKDIIMEVIESKLNAMKNHDDCDKQKDLLDLCIEMYAKEGEEIDVQELRSQVFTFLLAGHETTSSSMSWTLYLLAQYPKIQDKLRREINENLKDRELKWDMLESMEYLTAVINESLRLRPPVTTFRRVVIKEDNVLGYKIPPGSKIMLAPFLLNRSPEYWKSPETFDPDRFLSPDRDANPSHRFAFLPFSTGPRMCTGYKFAMIQMKVVLSMLLQHFRFSVVPGLSFHGQRALTYRPKPSLQLLVRNL